MFEGDKDLQAQYSTSLTFEYYDLASPEEQAAMRAVASTGNFVLKDQEVLHRAQRIVLLSMTEGITREEARTMFENLEKTKVVSRYSAQVLAVLDAILANG